jgi:hypothetical protein
MNIVSQTRRTFLRMLGVATSSLTFPTRMWPAHLPELTGQVDTFPMSYQFRLYTGLLRLYDEFDPLPDKHAPSFHYECSHSELDKLRDKYRFDQIAGGGDEWSKAMNLMQWMTEHVGYKADITSAKPEVCKSLPMNALGLLEYSFEKGQDCGINCYMHAIVLTEACLSLGLKCRIVSLNPLNPYDYDNHLVNVVWCTNLSKWAMVDSSYNAYLRDAEGTILNPWEVRDLFCRHKTVVGNDELVFQGVKRNSEGYLCYLAKNLVYMHSPTLSGFNTTTTSEQPWLTLAPKHLDVCKREAYNMKWRAEGDKGNWEDDELEKLRREKCDLVCTSSTASFSQKPI